MYGKFFVVAARGVVVIFLLLEHELKCKKKVNGSIIKGKQMGDL